MANTSCKGFVIWCCQYTSDISLLNSSIHVFLPQNRSGAIFLPTIVYLSSDLCLLQALFPDNTYGVDSGGDPRVIPSLSFEDFKVGSLFPISFACSSRIVNFKIFRSLIKKNFKAFTRFCYYNHTMLIFLHDMIMSILGFFPFSFRSISQCFLSCLLWGCLVEFGCYWKLWARVVCGCITCFMYTVASLMFYNL